MDILERLRSVGYTFQNYRQLVRWMWQNHGREIFIKKYYKVDNPKRGKSHFIVDAKEVIFKATEERMNEMDSEEFKTDN